MFQESIAGGATYTLNFHKMQIDKSFEESERLIFTKWKAIGNFSAWKTPHSWKDSEDFLFVISEVQRSIHHR